MNWVTKRMFEEAIADLADEGIWTPDQILSLQNMVKKIQAAADRESDLKKFNRNGGGHGF